MRSSAKYISGIYEGDFSAGYLCNVCDAFIQFLQKRDGYVEWEFHSLTEYDEYQAIEVQILNDDYTRNAKAVPIQSG